MADEPEVVGEGEELLGEHAEEIKEEVEEEQDVISILTEYDPDDFISGAVNSLDSSIPLNLFDFEHSYGYDCQKYFNLCACDETVVCWAAGSIIAFMDVKTKQTWFQRTTTGGSVGHITSYRKDPNYRIAIAEGREGNNDPVIILYTWPQLEFDAVLRDGTTNAFSIMDFSPDGELLASVGKEPDYNLTIWNWKRHKILLRTSAFTYDVNAVMFSPYCPGQLTTAGAAHIKFWKMAETFTGLKLKGELGRFGKTEICDVLGVYPMPDEKVLSGCEWGNVLVWEAGLVKLEVTQRGRKPCHGAPIIQFMLSSAYDEVTTVARDGCIRAWYWDTVEQADPSEEDPYVELNPVAETCVPGCQIMSLRHQKDLFWYVQDGNGGLWNIELDIDKIDSAQNKVMTCHAGAVTAMTVLRTHPILITAGEDGALMAYNTETHGLLAKYQFQNPITCMLYPPVEVEPTSRTIMVGFADGIMRTMFLHPQLLQCLTQTVEVRVHSALALSSELSVDKHVLDLISLLKPHSKSLTQISINHNHTLLVTCGEDSTIFMYKLEVGTPFTLHRLGFINTPNVIAFMTWKPDEERVILLCGQVGFIMEAVLPDAPVQKYTDITTFQLEFDSYKETLVKKQFMRNRPFPQEEDLASIDEEALKAKDEASKDDEDEEYIGEIQLMESDSMLGTTITWAQYCDEGIWVVQRGTGALFLIKPGQNKLYKYAPFPNAWCDDITVLKFICEDRYLIVGTNTGYIRVVRMLTEEEDTDENHLVKWMNAQQKLLKKLKGRRLAKEETQPIPRLDFDDNYYLPMHDFYTGAITCMEFSSDSKMLFTSGKDGNIFAFKINFPEPLQPPVELPKLDEFPEVMSVKEPSTLEGELMSHEQLKQKEEYDKMMAIANAHKKRVRNQLSELIFEYNKLIRANRSLPVSQQMDVTLDPRPLEVQESELAAVKALTVRKLAHQLEASDLALHKMYSRNIVQLDVFPFTLKAIRDPEVMIRPLRQKNLSKAFYDQLEEVYQKMAEAALRGRRAESMTRRATIRRASYGPPRVASFLLGMPPKPPHPLKKALRNYHQRLRRHHIQFIEWQEHLSRKPDPNALPPGASEALKQAEASIGNRLLKTQADYVAPAGHNTQLKVCMTRKEIYDMKHEFNLKVQELRQHKLRLVARMKQIGERLAEIRLEVPPKMAKPPPAIPEVDEDLEFPEKNLEIKPVVVPSTKRVPLAKHKQSQLDQRKSVFPQARDRQPRVARFMPLSETKPLSASWELLKATPDMESTPLEIEIRERRIERHLYEQDMLIADAEVSVQQFDSRLRELQRERIRVQEKNQLLELHLYQLHREMNVLNRFEAHEDRLAERVYSKLMQVRGVKEQISECEHRIEEHKAERENLDAACQDLQRQFKKLVTDSKFADFLRRIFKKKYRPPRVRDDDESSESESSSSSSEDDDEGSLDSRDIGPIRLDPNICPEGCDQSLFDKTYELRNTRHKHEQGMLEQVRLVELLRRDIDAHNRVKKKLSLQLDKRKNDLREFMLEKQNCMNDVEQVVVLRYDQLRASAVRGCAGAGGLARAVVFPERMLARLRQRVLELHDEIAQQKKTHKVNRTHLFRMNVDLAAMNERELELRAQMRDVLTRKLGRPRRVDRTLDDLLKQLARRHKLTPALATPPHVLHQLKHYRDRHSEIEKKYLRTMEEHTERLRHTAALQADVLPRKAGKEGSGWCGGYSPAQYRRDVVRLRIVRAQQLQQIQVLREEMTCLQLKPLSPRAVFPHDPTPPPEISEIQLFAIPRLPPKTAPKYFPTTPLGSRIQLSNDANVMQLLFECLDAMRVSRDDAERLLHDVSDQLTHVLAGTMSRFEVVDKLVRKWLLKHGGDPSNYKKQTRAFDTLAALADILLRQHIETMEGPTTETQEVMSALEGALKDISNEKQPLHERLGPALASLLHAAEPEDIETNDTMTSLVQSMVNTEFPITEESIDKIDVFQVVEDIKDCGVDLPEETLECVIRLAVDALRAQIVSAEEAAVLEKDVNEAMTAATNAMTSLEQDSEHSARSKQTDKD